MSIEREGGRDETKGGGGDKETRGRGEGEGGARKDELQCSQELKRVEQEARRFGEHARAERERAEKQQQCQVAMLNDDLAAVASLNFKHRCMETMNLNFRRTRFERLRGFRRDAGVRQLSLETKSAHTWHDSRGGLTSPFRMICAIANGLGRRAVLEASVVEPGYWRPGF